MAGINANRCRPCDGPNSRYTEHLNNCDHQVTKEHVLLSLKALNYTFTSFRHKVVRTLSFLISVKIVVCKSHSNKYFLHPVKPIWIFFLQENEINLIHYDHITPTCVQNPVSAKVKRKKVIFSLSIIIKIINFSIIDVLIRYNMCVKCHSY